MEHLSKIKLIQKGFQRLYSELGYGQSTVVAKLNYLGFATNTTAFNKIIKNKSIGYQAMMLVYRGMIDLIQKELCLKAKEGEEWVRLTPCQPTVIPTELPDTNRKGFILHAEGRLEIPEKVEFLSTAKKEIIEFGLTLNSFSSYLLSRKSKDFKEPLLELLRQGVHIRCYLMDPDWSGTSRYFDDRVVAINEGLHGIDKIKASIQKLKVFHQEIATFNHPGTFEVFKYRHFPNNYFLIIDQEDHASAKMMVSNYLYGLQRAMTPVMEFSRAEQSTLFIRYSESFKKITRDAKKIDFEKL